MTTKLSFLSVLLLLLMSLFQISNGADFNVINFGAKADGKTDATQPFLKAWALACSSNGSNSISVPKGTFLLKAITFKGPCKSTKITFFINGILVAPLDYLALGNSGYWILFIKVNGVSVIGGNINARGLGFWTCKTSAKKSCPVGARSMTFNWANDVVVSGLTSIDSQQTHISISHCNNVSVKNVKLMAPEQSPNTDGIHVQSSTGVTITGSTIQTGDDCISIGDGTKNLFMSNIKCGPGHGISIGSLGKELKEDGVENVTLTNGVFVGSDNGVRIKTWARPSSGFVRNVIFQDITMTNVKNPIIVDQNYCPNNKGCPKQGSGIKISRVTYRNIKGTSATEEAVVFDCSPRNPCQQMTLQDINLTFMNNPAKSSCSNIDGSTAGVVIPESCFLKKSIDIRMIRSSNESMVEIV